MGSNPSRPTKILRRCPKGRTGSSPVAGTNKRRTYMPEFDSEKLFKVCGSENPSPEEVFRQQLEDSLNYNLDLRRQRGIDPMPVIVTFAHIYNTYNSVERERWQKYGFARQTFQHLARMSVRSSR